MIEIDKIATNLQLGKHGIWISGKREQVSYPEDGNARCLSIEENSFWFDHRNDCIVEVMRSFPPNGPILDVGGGNGHVSLAVKNAGMEVILLEPGVEGAMNGKLRGLNPVICSTLEDAGFTPGSISAVGAFDVIEHIEDDDGFLETAKTLLARGGRLYLTAPAYSFLFSEDDRQAGHYRRYTLKSLAEKLVAHQFLVEYQSYIFQFLPVPVFLLRTIPSKLGFRKADAVRQKSEHKRRSGGLGRMLSWLLERELNAVRAKRSLSMGGSCLVVARSV